MKISIDFVANTAKMEDVSWESKILPITELVSEIAERFSAPPTGILPPAVRWIRQDGHAVIMERKPFSLNVRLTHPTNTDFHYDFQVPIPWTIMSIEFHPGLRSVKSVRLYARNAPLFDPELDTLGVFPYPNMYSNNEVCLGDAFASAYTAFTKQVGYANLSLENTIRFVTSYIWSTNFNNDVPTWMSEWRMPTQNGTFIIPPEYRNGPIIPDDNVNETAAADTNYSIAYKILYTYSTYSLSNFNNLQFTPTKDLSDPGKDDTFMDLVNKLSESIIAPNVAVLSEIFRA